jgi:tetratricopeptide (TPR) repeat protein
MVETPPDVIARAYLRTGRYAGISEADLASACEQLVQTAARKSLREALRTATKFASRARGRGVPLYSTALRVLGRISHQSGRHKEGLEAYLHAKRLLKNDRKSRARIDRILIDVYMYLNRFADARKAARRAIATFSALDLPSDLAQTKVNFGNLLHRQDRHRDAERLYREAADYFEGTDNDVAIARCYYNRANTLVQLFDMEEAERLYSEAQRMWQEAGFNLDACDARYGMAWLNMLVGRFHQALVELSECERTYREFGDPRGEALCLLDRAEVFLGLGLMKDARTAARGAWRKFEKLGLRYESAKAALFLGRASLTQGAKTETRRALDFARRRFTAERNQGFLGVIQLTEAELATTKAATVRLMNGARSHFSKAQLPYWRAVCDVRQATEFDDNGALVRLGRNSATEYVPYLYAVHQMLAGDRALARGHREKARQHWIWAADRLDAVRMQLPPLELRSAFTRGIRSPHASLIDMMLPDNPSEAAVWSERRKTAGIWAPLRLDQGNGGRSERDRVMSGLARLASEVAAMSAHVISGGGEHRLGVQALTRRLDDLRRDIRDHLTALETKTSEDRVAESDLARLFSRVSNEYPVVQFHMRPRDIVAFIHWHGSTRAVELAHGRERLTSAMQQWRFLLEVQLLQNSTGSPQMMAAENGLWAELGGWLWAPLNIPSSVSNVLILPEGDLANIPWGALVVDGVTLMEQYNIILSPSLRHHVRARTVHSTNRQMHIFRSISSGLAHVMDEVESLSKLAGDGLVVHSPATRSSWTSSGDAHIWHFSGHAELCEDNPFYSYLATDDGPTFAADFRLLQQRVNLITLASCRSGEQVAMPGEESTGLVRSLLEMGARNVVAAIWPVYDKSTSLWMQEFYSGLFENISLPEAMRHAALKVRENYPSAYHWSAFSAYGAGEMGGRHD